MSKMEAKGGKAKRANNINRAFRPVQTEVKGDKARGLKIEIGHSAR